MPKFRNSDSIRFCISRSTGLDVCFFGARLGLKLEVFPGSACSFIVQV